jgi:hypothetical protein
MDKIILENVKRLSKNKWSNEEIAKALKLSKGEVELLLELDINSEFDIVEIFPHKINYTFGELKQILKAGEVFRKYPKNPKLALAEIKPYLENISNDIEVSNSGNIKINGDDVVPFEKERGCFYVTLQGGLDYKVHRLVAETWCEFLFEDANAWNVYHIVAGDGSDNRADNLIWCNEIGQYIFNNP